jgi:uncharacterized protein YydD (DUF2326 family)
LEIELAPDNFLTVRRSVTESSRISFKKHVAPAQDFTAAPDTEWDHSDLPFERSKELLDSMLDWRMLKRWTFRKVAGYLLRSQADYREIFQLQKFASKHSDWKPFLAHLLGFQGDLVQLHYEKEEELAELRAQADTISQEIGGGSVEDISKIEGMLLLKRQEADKRARLLDAFDFRTQDKAQTKELVEEIDSQIGALNTERYSLAAALKKIHASLNDDRVMFDSEQARQLFDEAGVLFGGQLKKDFDQLVAFNKAVAEERRGYLEEEKRDIDAQLKKVAGELNQLGKRRSEALSFLSSTDVFSKYKSVSDELVTVRADIIALERQRGFLQRLQELRTAIRSLTEERQRLQTGIEADVEKQNSDSESLFSAIRIFFSEIVERVISRKALLSVSPNKEGHLEFRAEILDESGRSTSADDGHTYRKLLCVAFDLAVLRARLDQRAPRFVYHDGVFESLDDRKKENLLEVLREYGELGLQPIITAIDSDLPTKPFFSDTEIVVRLHDEGDSGRLFKMPPW